MSVLLTHICVTISPSLLNSSHATLKNPISPKMGHFRASLYFIHRINHIQIENVTQKRSHAEIGIYLLSLGSCRALGAWETSVALFSLLTWRSNQTN